MAKRDKDEQQPSCYSKVLFNTVIEGGCPTILRTDNGTENVIVAGMQCFFRCTGFDSYAGIKAHRYGKLTSQSKDRVMVVLSSNTPHQLVDEFL